MTSSEAIANLQTYCCLSLFALVKNVADAFCSTFTHQLPTIEQTSSLLGWKSTLCKQMLSMPLQ